jgi:hypothetical protein
MRTILDAVLKARPELAQNYSRADLEELLRDFLDHLASNAKLAARAEDCE